MLRPSATIVARHPPVTPPWTHEYNEAHRELVVAAVESGDVGERIRRRKRLPRGYGVSFDERVVEYPWLFAHRPFGRTLDAGSTLNHPHVLERILPDMEALHIVTLVPEAWQAVEGRVSYVYADLRDLPFRDGIYDTVVCMSTLEHVGMDNEVYGTVAPRAADPAAEAVRALRELMRVLAPHGRLLLTVPYGAAEDHGWFRQLDRAGLEHLLAAARPLRPSVVVYRYTERGWQASTLRRAAGARYRDHARDPSPAPDAAAAARAVACITLSAAG